MTNTDLEFFMEKLRRLVYENYYTRSIGNNPLIEARKPEIQLLYEELSYLITGSCFKDMMTIDQNQPHELEDLGKWKTRFIEAAQEAEDIVDMFVSCAIIKNDFKDNDINDYGSDDKPSAYSVPASSLFNDGLGLRKYDSDCDDELGSCFEDMITDEQEVEDVGNRMTRFIEAAEEAVDMFVSSANIKNDNDQHITDRSFKDMITDEQEVEDVGNGKGRLIEPAQEAEDIVDVFVSSAIIKNDFKDNDIQDDLSKYDSDYDSQLGLAYPQMKYSVFIDNTLNGSLQKLNDVMDDLKSIREEIMSIYNHKGNLLQNQLVNRQDVMMDNKLDKVSIVGTGGLGKTTLATKTFSEELIVGFDDDALSIIDRLTVHRKKLDIIPIVGMGGLGKTTLATKIFNNSLVQYHFNMRGWITVSQAHSKRNMLLQLLVSIGKSVHEATSESKLAQMLYQSLKGRRYLMVIDDIWSCKAWDDVGLCFPDDNTGSRVLVTTRLTEVASHASRGGFTHNLGHLNEDQSWELLCRKTFRGSACPENLIDAGKHIAKKCGGLPLALVVIAGLLEKGEKTKDSWEKIAERVGSYIIGDPNGCLDTLALSYDHLPCHLKKCFLYVGGFPEDCKVQVMTLIRLWMAEGFIKESGQGSMEEEGERNLMELVDRNLLVVADKRSNGGIKSCRLHDLLRELCLKKASEENFFKKMSMPMSNSSPFSDSASSMVKQHRLFTDYEVLCKFHTHCFATRTRSMLCFQNNQPLHRTSRWVPSYLLLRVLYLLNIPMDSLDKIRMLVHLRYLSVWLRNYQSLSSEDGKSSFSKANFGNLQTLIVKGKFQSFMCTPDNMVNLRHLRCDRIDISVDFHVHRLFNLQTVSRIRLDHMDKCLHEIFPNIKKLGCYMASVSSSRGSLNFSLLTRLEALNIERHIYGSLTIENPIRFPETLKKLTLKGLCLRWDYMSTIQRLPKLEVLKLLDSSIKGQLWETGDEQFHQLKYLKLEKLNIRDWEASSINFPCLRKLVVKSCDDLKEIPLGLGNSYTLEHIEIDYSNSSVLESVNRIQEAQREMGNDDIHVSFIRMDPSEVFYEGDPFFE